MILLDHRHLQVETVNTINILAISVESHLPFFLSLFLFGHKYGCFCWLQARAITCWGLMETKNPLSKAYSRLHRKSYLSLSRLETGPHHPFIVDFTLYINNSRLLLSKHLVH